MDFILASQSPARKELLERIGIKITKIAPADLDESELKGELPRNLASRLSKGKAAEVAKKTDNAYIVAADTVAAVGLRILPKAETDDMVRDCLKLLSGRRHTLHTGVTVIKKENGAIIKQAHKVVKSIVKFKTLTAEEIEFYVNSQEGLKKAGGYSIQGLAQMYISFISGSVSNIIGLPLYETRNMLEGVGFRVIK